MTQNRFDQASRYAAKIDPSGFLKWLLGTDRLPLPFRDWLDTRTLPFPGDPERTCDTVAWLAQLDRTDAWAVAVEFSLEPDATMFGRLLVYLGRLWLERRPPGLPSRFHVGAAVVNLTGQGQASRDYQLAGLRTCLQVIERNLAREDAATVQDGIAAGATGRCLLPWIPLMRGGDAPVILERWKTLALAEPDARNRSDYAGLALVFAEAAGRRELWKQALKEWNMVQSQVVMEWIAEGEIKGQSKMLLRQLAKKFPPGVPADLVATIQGCKDGEQLSRWSEALIDAATLDDFRRAMQ
jgi:hypothetical protein